MPDNITIRAMELSDLDAVYPIELAAHIAPWSRNILHDCIMVGYSCYVLLTENEIVAFSISRIAADELHILNLCVKPELQHQGFGQQLLSHIITVAKQRCKHVILEVRKSNVAAIKLYEKFGFLQIATRAEYYPGPAGREDAIIYSLEFK